MADPVLQSPRNPHFFQPLLPGFHSHFSVPLKFFSEHIEGRTDKNTVELRSDACERTWKVVMEGRRFTIGWKEFAIAHDFRIGDIIILRHDGDLVFHFTVFGPSCCEIQYVQSCNDDDDLDDHQDNIRNLSSNQNVKTKPESSQDDDKDNIAKRLRKKHVKKRIPEPETASCSSDQSCFVAPITFSNLREDRLFLPRKFVRPGGLKKGSSKIVLMNGQRTWTLNLKFRESSVNFYMNLGWRSFCHENGLQPGDSVTFKLERNNTRTPLLRLSTKCSKRKRIKTGETSQRVSSPSSSLSEKRFVTLTVTPNSFKKCRLYLPKSFTRVNGMENAGGKKITLLDMHGVEWPVNLLMEKRNGNLHLGSGLIKFLKATGVKIYESFEMELVGEDITSPMLKFCSKVKT